MFLGLLDSIFISQSWVKDMYVENISFTLGDLCVGLGQERVGHDFTVIEDIEELVMIEFQEIKESIALFERKNSLLHLRSEVKNLNFSVVLRDIVHPQESLSIKV